MIGEKRTVGQSFFGSKRCDGKEGPHVESFRALLRMVAALYRAGVPIVAGTDAALPGFVLHRELELYVEAGLPPAAVLQLATLGAARVMKHDAELGSVTAGKLADLIIVGGDPTLRIQDVRRVMTVIKNGVVYQAAELHRAMGLGPG